VKVLYDMDDRDEFFEIELSEDDLKKVRFGERISKSILLPHLRKKMPFDISVRKQSNREEYAVSQR